MNANIRAILRGGGWFDNESEALGNLRTAFNWVDRPHVGIIANALDGNPYCAEQAELIKILKAAGIPFTTLVDDNRDQPTFDRAEDLFGQANVIAAFGANVAEMWHRWSKTGIRYLAYKAITRPDNPVVWVGSSAGSGCLGQFCHTADRRLHLPKTPRHRLQFCLGILPVILSLHYNERHAISNVPRAESTRDMMLRRPLGTVAIGIDTQTAVEIDGESVRIVGDSRYLRVDRLERVFGRGLGRLRAASYKPNTRLTYDELFLSTTA